LWPKRLNRQVRPSQWLLVTSSKAGAPVGLAQPFPLLQMTVHRRRHPPLQDLLQSLSSGPSVIFAPFDPLRPHGLHHPERAR
jgi:hypothetical protein